MGILQKSAVGLEIDSKEIKAVHLSGNPDKPHLRTFCRFPLRDGVVKDGKVFSAGELGVALATMWTRENIKCRDVILGVNNQDIIVRFANFVKVPEDKLDNLIRYQAQEYIPIPIEEVELDYSIIGEENHDDENYYNVLLVAGKKKMLFDFMTSIQSAHLNIVDIGVSMLSFTKLVPNELSDLPLVVVNLSYDFGNIVIVDNKKPGMARTISFSREITQIADELSSKSPGDDCIIGDECIIDDALLDRFCSTLATEIRSSVLYYQSQKPNAVFHKILLIGSLVRVKNLVERLRQFTDTDVVVFSQKRSGVNLIGANNVLYNDSDYAICTNLAIRGLEV